MSVQKRLLLLGGSRYLLPVIEAAKGMGIYTITCDYLPDNIAHKYSDEYCNVSIIDKEAVLEAAKQLNVDGIMSFACDPGVVTAAYVAEKLGLPSCGSYESVSILLFPTGAQCLGNRSTSSSSRGSSSLSSTPHSAGISTPCTSERYSASRVLRNTRPPLPSVRAWKNSTAIRLL